ncbi:MAG: CBS domain-containing protein [Dehalococcoidia bacterium]|nr:CBS domain-containing protein [Dehalococcoidia bacterium]
MLVRDIMTTNVVTVSSETTIMDARKIMEAHNFERLPVVDKSMLVGIVTKTLLQRAALPAVTTLNLWDISYLLARITVRKVMKTSLVTVTPDMTAEAAATIAQRHHVGATPVVEDGKVVGILTANDYFYKILNPLLGINESGKRIIVYEAGTPDTICEVMQIVKKERVAVKTEYTAGKPEANIKDLYVHLDTEDVSKLTAIKEQLTKLGLRVDIQEHI